MDIGLAIIIGFAVHGVCVYRGFRAFASAIRDKP